METAAIVVLCAAGLAFQVGGVAAAYAKRRLRLAAGTLAAAVLVDAWVVAASGGLAAEVPPAPALAAVLVAVPVFACWLAEGEPNSAWERRGGDALLSKLLALALNSTAATAVAAVGVAYVSYGNWGGAVVMLGFAILILRQLVLGAGPR